MAKSTTFKKVVVKEDAKTSLRAAKIHPLRLAHGQKIVALGYLYFPYHDRSMFETTLKLLEAEQPAVVILQGGIVSEDAFKALWDTEDNYIHDNDEVPEVLEALQAGYFEDRVLSLAKSVREGLFDRIAKAVPNAKIIWIPAWTHLSMGNEVRLTEWVQGTKRNLDGWTQNHPDSSDIVSKPDTKIPKELNKLFGLDEGYPNIKVTRYGAGIELNKQLLFLIGDFRRRNAADASMVEWEQRGISNVRSFDGKVSSAYWTTPDHTLPGLRLKTWQSHEIGYSWDPEQNSHFRDYDRRAPGIFWGRVRFNKIEARSLPFRRGGEGHRSFVLNGKVYREDTPGATWHGEEIFLPEASEPAVLGTPAAISHRPVEAGAGKTQGAAKSTRERSKKRKQS